MKNGIPGCSDCKHDGTKVCPKRHSKVATRLDPNRRRFVFCSDFERKVTDE